MRPFGCEERVLGRDRQVFVFRRFVVKVPIMENWLSFIRGLYSNLREMETVRTYTGLFPEQVMKIKWSGLFGLILVVKRYQEVKDEREHRRRFYKHLERVYNKDHEWKFVWDEDTKVFNYGWDKYGRLVKIDLGIFH